MINTSEITISLLSRILAETVKILANAEKLDGHANAVSLREKYVSNSSIQRSSFIKRSTKETNIYINLDIDGSGKYNINTGIKFFDHMLEQFSKHGSFDITIQAIGDLDIDDHHTRLLTHNVAGT